MSFRMPGSGLAIGLSALLVTVALAGCAPASAPTATPSALTTQMPMQSEMPMPTDMPMDSGMELEPDALGEPGDPNQASRTIHITGDDQLSWNPDAVEINLGETITFEIENVGAIDHEFILGSAAYQQQHDIEMQEGHMEMGEPNELEVPAGETAALTWHFTQAGTTQYGCHEPGHFAGGMVGTITVSE